MTVNELIAQLQQLVTVANAGELLVKVENPKDDNRTLALSGDLTVEHGTIVVFGIDPDNDSYTEYSDRYTE